MSQNPCRQPEFLDGTGRFPALPATKRHDYHRVMTDAIAFDTHRFVKHLTASGFTEV